MKRVLVSGGNQGLGLGLVTIFAQRLAQDDIVYLASRDLARGEAAKANLLLKEGIRARIEVVQLDITNQASIERLAARLSSSDGLDIFVSNAAARMPSDQEAASYVRSFCETNNIGTRNILDAFLPLTRDRFLIVASSFGRLRHLDPSLRPLFADGKTADELGEALFTYVDALEATGKPPEPWPTWVNIPSKIHQVALGRLAARGSSTPRVNSVCPGLVDTAASRPWFSDMSSAQTPEAAAEHICNLALLSPLDEASPPPGALVQFQKVLPWDG